MIDDDARLFLHSGFRMQGDAHASGQQHWNIIGPVADRKCVIRGYFELAGQPIERFDLRFLAKHRLAHIARELAVFNEEFI